MDAKPIRAVKKEEILDFHAVLGYLGDGRTPVRSGGGQNASLAQRMHSCCLSPFVSGKSVDKL